MTIYGRFGDPVTITRLAVLEDIQRLDGRKPDKTDRRALELGSYVIIRQDDQKEILASLGYLRADGGLKELMEAVAAAPKPEVQIETILLSKSARDVLRKLETEGACPTSKSTHHRYVSGACVASLLRKGLVQRLPRGDGDEDYYEITNAGLQALKGTP